MDDCTTNNPRKNIPFLDYMRIVSAFFVFLFHSNIHVGIRYGFLTPFVNVGAIFMTAFFMLSGVSLAYNYESKDLLTYSDYCVFIKKRIISVYPGYIVLYALVMLKFLITKTMPLSVVENLVVFPVELTLFQSVFGNSFSTLHNGGTWFVSCIFICYLLFPFLCKVIMQMGRKHLACFSIFAFCILAWAPVVERVMKYSWIYPNPFFRSVEFALGICLIRCRKLFTPPRIQRRSMMLCVFFQIFLFIGGSAIKYRLKISSYCLYNFLTVPSFFLIFYYGISLENHVFDSVFGTKFFKYLVKISYVFFLAQFFTWDIYRKIQSVAGIEFNSAMGFLIAFSVCMCLTVIMYELMVKPVTKVMRKCLLKQKLGRTR